MICNLNLNGNEKYAGEMMVLYGTRLEKDSVTEILIPPQNLEYRIENTETKEEEKIVLGKLEKALIIQVDLNNEIPRIIEITSLKEYRQNKILKKFGDHILKVTAPYATPYHGENAELLVSYLWRCMINYLKSKYSKKIVRR